MFTSLKLNVENKGSNRVYKIRKKKKLERHSQSAD